MKKNAVLFLLLGAVCLFAPLSNAQQTAVYTNPQFHYQEGLRFFDLGLYGPAQREFAKYLKEEKSGAEERHGFYERQAELYIARAAVRNNDPQAEALVLAFIQEHAPDPIATEATLEIANDYYQERQYEKAIAYYNLLESADLKPEQKAEAYFKLGYCHFVLKEFDAANMAFSKVKNEPTRYYYPTNYYLGMTAFFEKDFNGALQSFERVAKSEMYASFVPYYIIQIQFAQSNYPVVIEYGEKSLEMEKLQNRKEIRHLVGKAYFEERQYANALPHLEYYAEKSGKMLAEDFYQLGFVQYQLGMCEKSAHNFKQLHLQETAIGQQAHYYMADCFLDKGDLTSARTAFHAVSKMDFDPSIRDEALFNYGKLSAQLRYDQEAIASLESFGEGSAFYQEAQEVLKSLFIRTRDYDYAISKLETSGPLSPSLREAYQKVTYSRAIQYMNDGNLPGAQQLLEKSIGMPSSKELLAQAWFWKGEIFSREGDYDKSIGCYDEYFRVAKQDMDLPVESSPSIASYNQGYNYLKKEAYKRALSHFEKAVEGFGMSGTAASAMNAYRNLQADALLRAGDCAFKRNDYATALSYYQASIDGKEQGFIYAIYQKALIKGLQGDVFSKIALLEEIHTHYPENPYMPEVLFELASTYQENGNAEKAVYTFERITNRYHQNAALTNVAYLRLGLVSYNNGDTESALRYYKAVFDRNPEPKVAKEAITAVEEIYIRDLGQPEKYVRFMDAIPGYNVSEFRKDSLAFIAAETRYENAQYANAITGFTNYINNYPKGVYLPAALYHRAESYSIGQDYSSAMKDYERVVALGQNKFYTEALYKAASIAYNDALDFEKALKYYQLLDAKEIRDDIRFEAQLGALRSAYRLDKSELIGPLATRVIENKNASETQRSTAYFYRGKVALERKEYQNALADFNDVIKRSSNEQAAEARYQIAKIYYTQEAYDVAEQLCLNVNKENANYPDWVARSIILLSDIHVARKDLFNARAALEAVIENFTGDESILREARLKLEDVEAKEKAQSRLAPEANKSGKLELIEQN